jgi:hypothetical protein
MLNSTKAAVSAILSADPSVTPEQKKAMLQAAAETPAHAVNMQRVIKRNEASQLLGLGLKRVDQLARAGVLTRVTLPGCKRSIGFSEASLRAITEQGVSNA